MFCVLEGTWDAGGRGVCIIGVKNQFLGFWVLLLLALLSSLVSSDFLWRLPGFTFLLLFGTVCLDLCSVLFLEPVDTSAGLLFFLRF